MRWREEGSGAGGRRSSLPHHLGKGAGPGIGRPLQEHDVGNNDTISPVNSHTVDDARLRLDPQRRKWRLEEVQRTLVLLESLGKVASLEEAGSDSFEVGSNLESNRRLVDLVSFLVLRPAS